MKELSIEEKELLLKDLSARLPYGVKVWHYGVTKELLGIIPSTENVMVGYDINDYEDSVIEDIKPYLRPISSMTEEELLEYHNIKYNMVTYRHNYKHIDVGKYHDIRIVPIEDYLDWLNKKMFAYWTIDGKDMFELGLALVAPADMYHNLKNK